jgi:glycosyltransferase involved in cell wall biosynthesis
MLSFIVPAHNEEAWLGRSLAAILSAANAVGEAYEVIVVDDASTDATAAIAREQGVLLIQVAHRQIAAARNAGARQADGRVLFFVDADTLVTDAVIRSALGAIDGGAIGGGCIPVFEGRLPAWVGAIYPVMVFALRRILHQTGGACLFCTRRGFDTTGGFSERHFAAEEDIWVKSLKRHGRFVVLPETVTTSGRNLRSQSFWTIAMVFMRLAICGPDGFRSRKGLDLWYRPRREKRPTP